MFNREELDLDSFDFEPVGSGQVGDCYRINLNWNDIKDITENIYTNNSDYSSMRVKITYIDDEGLLVDDEDTNFCFTFGICDPIYGKGLIMGLDYDNGETTDKPFVPMEIYSDHIIFGWSADKPKPKFEITPFTLEDLKCCLLYTSDAADE